MRLKDFFYVSEVAKHKSFSKASKALFISQPALSKAVKRLENELGIDLFIRDNVSVSLTDAGIAFLIEAERIIEIVNRIDKRMSKLVENKKHTLRIGSSQFYIKYFLPNLMPELISLHPEISIEVTENVSYINEKNLVEDKLDLAIVPLPVISPSLKCETIFEETFQFSFCTSNTRHLELYNKARDVNSFDLSAFKDEPFILLKKGFKMRNLAETICGEYGFSPTVILETENFDTVNSLISNNYGVSFLPSFIRKYENVKYVDFNSSNSKRKIVAAYKTIYSSDKSICNFVKCLKKVLCKSIPSC